MFGLLLNTTINAADLFTPTILAQIVNLPSREQIYQPVNRKTSRHARKSGGSRGSCPQKIKSGITLLVPEDHIPLTTSAYPTFAWYQEQQLSLPVKFTLLEPGQSQHLYSQELSLNKSGLMSLTIPENFPPLEIGKKYRWSVAIICNRQHPSQNPYAEAWVERISWQSTKLASWPIEKEEFCQGYAYARAGIWYDAVACGLNQSTKEHSNLNYLSILLKQVDLEYIIERQPSISQK